MQGFLQTDYAFSFGPFTIGVAPAVTLQLFGADDLGAFAGQSSNPEELANCGTQTSYGVGLHGGVEWRATKALRIGVSGGTPSIDPAGYYVPRTTVTRAEFAPVPNPGTIAMHLSEAQVTLGRTYHFGSDAKAIKAAF